MEDRHHSVQEYVEGLGTRFVVNRSYQRSPVWKSPRKYALMKSMINKHPIGAVVLWKKHDEQFEILDGQQRILTIHDFIKNNKEFKNKDQKLNYLGLSETKQIELKAYPIMYILISNEFDENTVAEIFIKLQEGVPLKVAEKLYAMRGNFRKQFIKISSNPFFNKVCNKRFNDKWIAAMFLALELEIRFDQNKYPYLDYKNFQRINERYKDEQIETKVDRCMSNVSFLYNSIGMYPLNVSGQKLIGPYLLVSYLAYKQIMPSEKEFRDFMINLFIELDGVILGKAKKPEKMPMEYFNKLHEYKMNIKSGITSDSFQRRREILYELFSKRNPTINKDPMRFATRTQKRKILYYQDTKCDMCNKDIKAEDKWDVDHITPHSKGGKTLLKNLRAVHRKCHEKHNKK